MVKTAEQWLKKQNLDNDYRFDIISVVKNAGAKITMEGEKKPKIEHIKNITLY